MVYLFVVFIIIILDLIIKEKIKKKYELNKMYKIKNNLYIFHIKNRGIALSLFKNKISEILVVTGTLISFLFCLFFYSIKKGIGKFFVFSLSCVLGGALANFIDRFKNKEVTDYLYYKKGKLPIFNLADFFIIFGCLSVIISKLFEKHN